MAKKISPAKPPVSLPAEKKRLLLPEPGKNIWWLLTLASLPVLFVLVYALYPWFTVSHAAASTVVKIAVVVFLLGLVVLIFSLLKLIYDLIKRRSGQPAKSGNILTLTLLLVISLLFFSTIVQLIVS